jgi:hypothetical protein
VRNDLYRGIRLEMYPPSLFKPVDVRKVFWRDLRIGTVWREGGWWSFALGDSLHRDELYATSARTGFHDPWIAARRAVDEYQELRRQAKQKEIAMRRREREKRQRRQRKAA